MEALIDDVVEEILLRFPPDDPASLLRAALVCKGWCRIVSGPGFNRRFQEFHRTPPTLGFLCNFGRAVDPLQYSVGDTCFVPATSSLRRLPHAVGPRWLALDALHGRILFYDRDKVTFETRELDLFVWSPMITGEVWRLPSLVPPNVRRWSARLLCGAPAGSCDDDHVDCLFRVVVLSKSPSTGITSANVYSSEQHAWSVQASMQHNDVDSICIWGVLRSARIGNNALYFHGDSYNTSCIEYHIGKQQLSMISLPSEWENNRCFTFMTTENGGLGLAMVEDYNLYTLSRVTGIDGQARWGNKRAFSLSKFLPANMREMHVATVVDVPGVIWIGTEIGLFSIDIKSSQVKKLWEGTMTRYMGYIVPYMSFCTPVVVKAGSVGPGEKSEGGGRKDNNGEKICSTGGVESGAWSDVVDG